MLQRIKYFQAVVQYNSFSEAAAECNISQSAISQQVRSLENELGFALLERRNRKFSLTPAGEFFYKKSLILVNDYERICAEAMRLAGQAENVLRLGCLNSYGGSEFYTALGNFTRLYPDVNVKTTAGSHENLFAMLRSGVADLVFSDQRRAFSDEYVNLLLASVPYKVVVSANSPLGSLGFIAMDDLKNTPCILPVPETENVEQDYLRKVLGLQSEIIFAGNNENARLLVFGGSGFMLRTGDAEAGSGLKELMLMRGGEPVMQALCAFWKKENTNAFTEKFAVLLKTAFETVK